MFADCNNNPVNQTDYFGAWPKWLDNWIGEVKEEIHAWVEKEKENHYSRNEHNILPGEDELMDIVIEKSDEWAAVDDSLNIYHRVIHT